MIVISLLILCNHIYYLNTLFNLHFFLYHEFPAGSFQKKKRALFNYKRIY